MKSCSKLDTIRSGGLQRREQALWRGGVGKSCRRSMDTFKDSLL